MNSNARKGIRENCAAGFPKGTVERSVPSLARKGIRENCAAGFPKFFFFFFFFLLLLAACGQKAELSFLADHHLPSPAQASQASLGKGFDVEKERFAGDCVVGDTEYVGLSEARLKFERSLSEKEVADTLGFSLGTKARFGAWQLNAAADFAKASASDAYSESTVYAASYHFKNAKLRYHGLSPIGEKAAGGKGSYVWEQWTQTCGHEFVEQLELGARLLISAKIEFASREDKLNFSARFKIKGPAFAAKAELEKASRVFGSTAAIYINALQIGGDVRRLSQIFTRVDHTAVHRNGSTTHALLNCSMNNLAACMQVLDAALRYATDLGDESAFPNQIKAHWDPLKPDGPATLAYITKPWSDLAIYPPPPLISTIVKEARHHLAKLFEEQLTLLRRIDSLQTGPLRLTLKQRQRLQENRKFAADNLQQLYGAAMSCYQSPEQCPERYQEASHNLKIIDPDSLTVHPESFAQWCDAWQTESLPPSLSPIIASLMHTLGLNNKDPHPTADICAQAESLLLEKKELDLSQQNLEDLRVLKSLPHLERLNLSQNLISDVSALASLSQLTHLYLNRNRISELSPLNSLSKLRVLHASRNHLHQLPSLANPELTVLRLADNHISSLTNLHALPSLQELVLTNNKLTSLLGLDTLQKLKHLDVSYNQLRDFTPLSTMPTLQSIYTAGNPASYFGGFVEL